MESPVTTSSNTSASSARRWVIIGIIMALCLMIRLPGLMSLPVFCDEAIYLRWAQLIRGDGVGSPHLWISLADPKPPLHFWLIAAVLHLAKDPLLPARLLSVVAGLLSIPFLILLCEELGRLFRRNANIISGHTLGLIAAIFFVFSPFISFYQRFATAESLFLCESLAIVWLSLRWARRLLYKDALALGLVIGLALMTRQGISYTLCIMPAVAWVLFRLVNISQVTLKFTLEKTTLQFFLAALLAAALWSPYLTAELSRRVIINRQEATGEKNPSISDDDYKYEIKRRILYQDKFTQGQDRLAIATRNFKSAFTPSFNTPHPTHGWLWYYLTPPIYLLSIAGFITLALRRQWLVLVILAAWLIVTLAPVIILGSVVYSRYILSGVPPLIICAGWGVIELATLFLNLARHRPALGWGAVIVLFITLLVKPFHELGLQSTQWWKQTFTEGDHYQYIRGWPAGFASQNAIRWLEKKTQDQPAIVITASGWGTPPDALWVYLSSLPNIKIYYSDTPEQIVRDLAPTAVHQLSTATFPAPPSTPLSATGTDIWARPHKWLWPPYQKIHVSPGTAVYYVTKGYEGGASQILTLRKTNPTLAPIAIFPGRVDTATGKSDLEGEVVIFDLSQ